MKDKLKKQLERLIKHRDQLNSMNYGKEKTDYTDWDMGYITGKISMIEDLIKIIQ